MQPLASYQQSLRGVLPVRGLDQLVSTMLIAGMPELGHISGEQAVLAAQLSHPDLETLCRPPAPAVKPHKSVVTAVARNALPSRMRSANHDKIGLRPLIEDTVARALMTDIY